MSLQVNLHVISHNGGAKPSTQGPILNLKSESLEAVNSSSTSDLEGLRSARGLIISSTTQTANFVFHGLEATTRSSISCGICSTTCNSSSCRLSLRSTHENLNKISFCPWQPWMKDWVPDTSLASSSLCSESSMAERGMSLWGSMLSSWDLESRGLRLLAQSPLVVDIPGIPKRAHMTWRDKSQDAFLLTGLSGSSGMESLILHNRYILYSLIPC